MDLECLNRKVFKARNSFSVHLKDILKNDKELCYSRLGIFKIKNHHDWSGKFSIHINEMIGLKFLIKPKIILTDENLRKIGSEK